MNFFNQPAGLSATLSETFYEEKEKSFIHSNPGEVSLVTGHQYVTIDLSLSKKRVTGCSGFLDLTLCRQQRVETLSSQFGALFFTSKKENLKEGIGYDYLISGLSLFDPKKQLLQIGESAFVQEAIRISSNVTIGLHDQKIVCVQVIVRAYNERR